MRDTLQPKRATNDITRQIVLSADMYKGINRAFLAAPFTVNNITFKSASIGVKVQVHYSTAAAFVSPRHAP